MIKPSIQTLWLAVVVLLCASGCLVAQVESPASFGGSISDADAQRLSNVSVLIESKDRQLDVRSDESGEFKVELLAGTYKFTLKKDGFKRSIFTDFMIRSGTDVTYRFAMEPGECSDCSWRFEDQPEPPVVTTSSLPISSLIFSPQSAPNIDVNGYASADKVQRGRIVQVAVVMEIPKGYHVNSNRPLESFLVATQLKVEAPGGVRLGPVLYPRALLRNFSFSKDKLSVYEGRAVLRFNVTMPANFSSGSMELKAKLRYQSCSDALCFPPQSREVKVEIPVVGANEPVKKINAEYFGRSR